MHLKFYNKNTVYVEISSNAHQFSETFTFCYKLIMRIQYTQVHKQWMFGSFFCRTIAWLQGSSVIVSMLTMTAIALDRYNTIVRMQQSSTKSSFFSIVIIWLAAFIFCFPLFIVSKMISGTNYPEEQFCGDYCDEIGWTTEGQRKAYGLFLLSIQFVIPLLVTTCCYWRIICRVRQSSEIRSSSEKVAQEQARLNRVLSATVILFASSWFLQVLFNVLRDFGLLPALLQHQEYFWFMLAHCIAMTGTLWNGLIHGGLNREFHRIIRAEVLSKRNKEKRLLNSELVTYSTQGSF